MSEEFEAKRIGAKLQRNSGRGYIEKGDATLGDFLIDIKEYTESFSVSRKVWAKCKQDAWKMRKIPMLFLALGEKGKTTGKIRLVVIEEDIFLEMKEAWESLND